MSGRRQKLSRERDGRCQNDGITSRSDGMFEEETQISYIWSDRSSSSREAQLRYHHDHPRPEPTVTEMTTRIANLIPTADTRMAPFESSSIVSQSALSVSIVSQSDRQTATIQSASSSLFLLFPPSSSSFCRRRRLPCDKGDDGGDDR